MTKNILYSTIMMLLILALSSSACKSMRSKLIGYWEIYKIEEGHEGYPKEKRNKYIQLNEDNTMTGGRIGEEPNKKGRWEFNKKDRSITITSETELSDDGTYVIEEISRDELILSKGGRKVYLDHGLKDESK